MTFPPDLPSLLRTPCSAASYQRSATRCACVLRTPAPYCARVVVRICDPFLQPSDLQRCPHGGLDLSATYCSHEPYPREPRRFPSSCTAARVVFFAPTAVPAALPRCTGACAVPAHCYLRLTAGVLPMREPPRSSVVRAAAVLSCAREPVPPTLLGLCSERSSRCRQMNTPAQN
ncbi:hypothetical protein B0H14DRAFT_3058460, partial [Mycena olivaceomarginata]